MRVWLAGLFVFGGMLLAIILLGDWLERVHPLIGGLLMSIIFLVLCIVAFILFNLFEIRKEMSDIRKWEAEYEQQIREWEAQGLLDVTHYRFKRVFCVEADEETGEGEGPHYFFELDNGSVLYLFGHYLHGLETFDGSDFVDSTGAFMVVDTPDILDTASPPAWINNIPFHAGNTRRNSFSGIVPFYVTVTRHKTDGRIIRVFCDVTAPILDRLPAAFWNKSYCQNRVFNDGDILTDCTYDQLLARS